MTKQTDLTAYVFAGQPHPLFDTLMRWMESSSRFTTFVELYRDKIRKKLRVTREPESILDLRGELEVAYCLLNDLRLDVAYEPYASAKRRGPDFAVKYRTKLVFNIEVTRLRVEENGDDPIDFPRKKERILRILLDKLGQMQPGMANMLVIHTHPEFAQSIDLSRLIQEIKCLADQKNPAFYTACRYKNSAGFYKDFLRLSGILFWVSGAQPWINTQAWLILSEKVLRLINKAACAV